MAQREVIEVVKKYIKLLNSSGILVQKAYLFGSYAKQEASSESDIDVMLVSRAEEDPSIDVKTKAWALTRKIDTRIEPYIVGLTRFTSDEFSPLLQIVKKEGMEIMIH